MKDGHAIHGTLDVRDLGKPASHGCVRLSLANATTLFALVKQNGLQNTQVVLGGVTPGGEYKGAGPASAARYYQASPAGYQTGGGYYSQQQARTYYAQPQARAYYAQPQARAYNTQPVGRPYYAAPQGYYAAPQGYYVVPYANQ
jgi:L,D-transpeptidase catalytic domain